LYDSHNKNQTQNMWKNLSTVTTQFVTKERLKYSTHMLNVFESHVTNYINKVFSYVPTLKYMCHFRMSSKKLNPIVGKT
jgi:hypothetical protein